MNEYFAQSLAQVLEETSINMGNAMVLDHLSNKGSVTLEEAEFYHNLCADVITEAAEDFIPDTLEVPEAPEEEAPIELYDAVGNKYVFDNGNLIPVESDTAGGDAGYEGEEDDMGAEDMGAEPAPEAPVEPEVPAEEVEPAGEEEYPEEEEEEAGQVPPQFQESEEAEAEEVLEEAEEEATEEVVEESEVTEEPAGEEVVEESEVTEEAAIEESEVTEEADDLLEESDNVVARILANLKA